MRPATHAGQRLAQRDIGRPQVARREVRRLGLDRVRPESRHGLGSVRYIPFLAQRAVWMCPTSGLQESQAWKGFLPTKRMRSPADSQAPGANALGCECPPASAAGRRLLLDFAPKGIRTRVPACAAFQRRNAREPGILPTLPSSVRRGPHAFGANYRAKTEQTA